MQRTPLLDMWGPGITIPRKATTTDGAEIEGWIKCFARKRAVVTPGIGETYAMLYEGKDIRQAVRWPGS